MINLDDIASALEPHGLIPRGGFAPRSGDGLEGYETVVLVGNAGPAMFERFGRWLDDGGGRYDNPMDAWSRAVIDDVAAQLGAEPLYPFDGPPYRPFQQWAMRAEPVHPSPLGILIHPAYGLWHAYRGALAFPHGVDMPEPDSADSPCRTCADKPCLGGCPVAAFAADPDTPYDVPACIGYLATAAGEDCLARGCLARRACPVGRTYTYSAAQSRFHMDAFHVSNRPA